MRQVWAKRHDVTGDDRHGRDIKEGHRYVILSDEYGLVMDDEAFETYDTHPSDVSDEQWAEPDRNIRSKCDALGAVALVFYNTIPT